MIRFAIPASLCIAAMSFAPVAHAAEIQMTATGPVIELSIFESVEIEPDMATISAGVTSEAPTAVEALRANSAEMRRVVDRIKSLGIAERDIQTSGISLNPRYDYDRTDQRPIFRGYQVSNRVSVKLRDIEATGKVLDALVVAGATDIGGPNFSVEDDSEAQETARKRAMERARQRAQNYAKMAGYEGIRLLEISEAITGNGPVPMLEMRKVSNDSVAAAPPVQPGMISTGVSISVKYEMFNNGK